MRGTWGGWLASQPKPPACRRQHLYGCLAIGLARRQPHRLSPSTSFDLVDQAGIAEEIKLDSNDANHDFEKEVERILAWLKPRTTGALGYPAEELLHRVMQAIVGVALPSYASLIHRRCADGREKDTASGEKLLTGRATIGLGIGEVRIRPRQALLNIGEFLIHWALSLASLMHWWGKSASSDSVVLVYGVGIESLSENNSDHRFVQYCRTGPIRPLSDGKRLIVQLAKGQQGSSSPAFTYARHPLLQLFNETPLRPLRRIQLTVRHLGVLIQYLLLPLKAPHLLLLGRDFAEAVIAQELDDRHLIDAVVLSAANYPRQPMWLRQLRNATTHMVWYSQSAKPIVYVDGGLASDMPSFRWIRVDRHWVWTRAFAKYLESILPGAKIEAVGPIVWYLPEPGETPEDVLSISIIDVPPCSDAVSLSNGVFPNYHQPEKMRAFVTDTLALRGELETEFGRPVVFRLKTKRGYRSGYDRDYFVFLDELADSGALCLENHSNNLFSMIAGSHLVVVFPFSSPAYIADFVGTPCVYYDPTSTVVRSDFRDDPSRIDFAATPDELRKLAIRAIRDRLARIDGP